jgi:urease accessory protein
MKRANAIIAKGASRLEGELPTITLDREERYRRRITWTTDDGAKFLLDLAEATYLPHGTGLVFDDGSIVIVHAAPEELLQITTHNGDAHALARIAWHIGNRHTPAEITSDAIFILPDHVLAEMVQGLGGIVARVSRPFEPEGGAYGGHGSLERGHHHHDHNHNHEAGHHGHKDDHA